MNEEMVSIGIVYGGFDGEDHRILLEGHRDDDAVIALEKAVLARTGRDVSQYGRADGESVFVLSSTLEDDADQLGWDYLHLPAQVTFHEMRAIIGPHDFETRALVTGFGGDGIFDGFAAWTVVDALNFGRDALEFYGAAEVVRRLGRAMRRRARRDRRLLADAWAHEGGAIPELLREAVERQHSWSDDDIRAYFELDRTEAQALMTACGYRWSSEDHCYHRPSDLDAVN